MIKQLLAKDSFEDCSVSAQNYKVLLECLKTLESHLPGVIFEIQHGYKKDEMFESNTITVVTYQKSVSFTINDLCTDFETKKQCIVNLQ